MSLLSKVKKDRRENIVVYIVKKKYYVRQHPM